jgi:hypothetical protein
MNSEAITGCEPPDTPASAPPDRSPASLNSGTLDLASWEHVDKLCEQLLSCSKLSVKQWKVRYIPISVMDKLATDSNRIIHSVGMSRNLSWSRYGT